MAKPRKQRKRQVARRRPVKPTAAAMQPTGVDAETRQTAPSTQIGEYVDRSRPTAPQAATDPIPQTSSWSLWSFSTQLWYTNRRTSFVVLVLPALLSVIGYVLVRDVAIASARGIFGSILLALSNLWLLASLPVSYYLQTQAAVGRQPSVWDCYRGSVLVAFRLLGLITLTSVVVLGGLLLLIVPGLIVFRRYALAPYYVIDQNLGIREAMQRSSADSKPVRWSILGVYGVYLLITIGSLGVIGQIFPPYGMFLAFCVVSSFVYGPALRYREVALRRSASSALPAVED